MGFEPDSWVSIPMGFEPDSWVSIPRVRTRLLGFRSRWGSNPTPGLPGVSIPEFPVIQSTALRVSIPKVVVPRRPVPVAIPPVLGARSLRRRGCRSHQAWGGRSVMIARQRSGAAEARWAHNPKVGGSKPPSASFDTGGLAQSVECLVCNEEAPGSKPGFSTTESSLV